MASRCTTVLVGYKSLLRASRAAFKGDREATVGAAVQIREAFEANRGLTHEVEIEEALATMRDAHDFLVHNVVQASLNPEGNYNVEFQAEHIDGETRADLHIVRKDDVVPGTPSTGVPKHTVRENSGSQKRR